MEITGKQFVCLCQMTFGLSDKQHKISVTTLCAIYIEHLIHTTVCSAVYIMLYENYSTRVCVERHILQYRVKPSVLLLSLRHLSSVVLFTEMGMKLNWYNYECI